MTRRSDGRFMDYLIVNGTRKYFYGDSPQEVKHKINQFNDKEPEIISFKRVADEWEAEHFAEIEPGTQNCYTPALKRLHNEFDKVAIRIITPENINAVLQRVAGQRLSKKTVQTVKTVVSMIFNYAIQHKYIPGDTNPVMSVRIPRHLPSETREAATPEQIKTIIENKDIKFGFFAFFLLYTGCRRGEALALKWGDIDFKKKMIVVTMQIDYAQNYADEKGYTKTKAGERIIPILSPLEDELIKRKAGHADKEFIFGNGKEPMSPTSFNHAWRQYALKTGFIKEYFVNDKNEVIPNNKASRSTPHKKVKETYLTPHQLRHSFATMLYEAEIAPKDAQKLMGHADIRTTNNIYTHIDQCRIAVTADKINAFLKK